MGFSWSDRKIWFVHFEGCHLTKALLILISNQNLAILRNRLGTSVTLDRVDVQGPLFLEVSVVGLIPRLMAQIPLGLPEWRVWLGTHDSRCHHGVANMAWARASSWMASSLRCIFRRSKAHFLSVFEIIG